MFRDTLYVGVVNLDASSDDGITEDAPEAGATQPAPGATRPAQTNQPKKIVNAWMREREAREAWDPSVTLDEGRVTRNKCSKSSTCASSGPSQGLAPEPPRAELGDAGCPDPLISMLEEEGKKEKVPRLTEAREVSSDEELPTFPSLCYPVCMHDDIYTCLWCHAAGGPVRNSEIKNKYEEDMQKFLQKRAGVLARNEDRQVRKEQLKELKKKIEEEKEKMEEENKHNEEKKKQTKRTGRGLYGREAFQGCEDDMESMLE